MNSLGRPLVIIGAVMIIVGIIISMEPKFPEWFGKLPGDISIKKGNFSLYFPLATCLLLSAIISIILWMLKK